MPIDQAIPVGSPQYFVKTRKRFAPAPRNNKKMMRPPESGRSWLIPLALPGPLLRAERPSSDQESNRHDARNPEAPFLFIDRREDG